MLVNGRISRTYQIPEVPLMVEAAALDVTGAARESRHLLIFNNASQPAPGPVVLQIEKLID